MKNISYSVWNTRIVNQLKVVLPVLFFLITADYYKVHLA